MVLLKQARRTGTALLMVLCLLSSTVCATARHHLHHRKKLVQRHVQRVMALQARGPQPRVLNVAHQLQLRSFEMLEPRQTVLHRCDEVACCAFNQRVNKRCFPTEEEVTLYFRVTDIGTKKKRVIEHQFRNHTKCQCGEDETGL